MAEKTSSVNPMTSHGASAREPQNNMSPRNVRPTRQPYPRESGDLLAARSLLPSRRPPLTQKDILAAIQAAYDRAQRNRVGKPLHVSSTPKELVQICIEHLKERSDPILSPHFYSLCDPGEIFDLDAISYEMQRQRMKIGVFYQFLIIALMRTAQTQASKLYSMAHEKVMWWRI